VPTITFPPTASRMIRLGDPTSSRPSGVMVAAFRPKPAAFIAAAASVTTPLRVARRLSREVEALELERQFEQVGIEDAQRLLEQLLPGLVTLEDDDPDDGIGHGVEPLRR
jgi:hypothetical protein